MKRKMPHLNDCHFNKRYGYNILKTAAEAKLIMYLNNDNKSYVF